MLYDILLAVTIRRKVSMTAAEAEAEVKKEIADYNRR